MRLRTGDLLVGVGNTEFLSLAQLTSQATSFRSLDTVPLLVRRGEQQVVVHVPGHAFQGLGENWQAVLDPIARELPDGD